MPAGASSSSFFGTVFRPMRFLKGVEWQGAAVAQREHLAVEHDAVGQKVAQSDEFRKPVGHQFLAARPQMVLSFAQDELAPDAVPLPLRRPVVRVPEPHRERCRAGRRAERGRAATGSRSGPARARGRHSSSSRAASLPSACARVPPRRCPSPPTGGGGGARVISFRLTPIRKPPVRKLVEDEALARRELLPGPDDPVPGARFRRALRGPSIRRLHSVNDRSEPPEVSGRTRAIVSARSPTTE